MWVVKFEFDGSKVFFGELAKKFGVELTGYPISSYEKNNQLYINLVGTLKGKIGNKSKILNFLKNSKYIIHIEESNDFFNLLIKEDKKFKPFYNPFFIYLSPIYIDQKGVYSYRLGSWNRKELENLINFIEKNYKYKLQTLKQEKINTISILGIQPDLTDKQKKAYELAIKNGYYEYPKNIELKQLAKMSNLSYSTFQQHLKYAEKKISNFFIGKY